MNAPQTQPAKADAKAAPAGAQAAKAPKKHEAAPGATAPAEPGKPGEANKAPEAPKTPKVRASKDFPRDKKITLVSEKNPKREGSKSHKRFALYKTGMTVGEFVDAGGLFADLAWDAERGFVTIEGHTPVIKEKKPKPEKKAEGAAPAEGAVAPAAGGPAAPAAPAETATAPAPAKS